LGNKGLRLIKARREVSRGSALWRLGHTGPASGRRWGAAAPAAQPGSEERAVKADGGDDRWARARWNDG